MEVIAECKFNQEFCVFIPTIVLFKKVDNKGHSDLTFAWLWFGISLRF
jgi:hypothetical protein